MSITSRLAVRALLCASVALSQIFFVTSATAQSANEIGQWGDVMSWPHVAVSMANLPDGRVLTWSGSERRTWPSTERTFSATWNPATNEFIENLFDGHNMFCAHLAMTEEGGVFVNGGRNSGNSPWTTVFSYQDNAWRAMPNMASGGRWYPTTLALGNGSIMTAMGNSTNVRNPDVWNPNDGWRVLNGINFIDMRQEHNEILRDSTFPLLSLTPAGEVYHFWSVEENHLINVSGNGAARFADPVTDGFDHAGGIQVNYDIGKLLISGANDGSWNGNSSNISAAAFTVDLNGAVPVIQSTNPMGFPRKFHQLIPLPTGEVLAVGGNTTGAKFQDNGSVMQAEIWEPVSGQWRTTAAMAIPRDYHSTAILLTDGRILTAGGGYHPSNPNSGGTHQDAQIFSPPYLFDDSGNLAQRPQITSSTSTALAGGSVTVSTQGNIGYFSLIKMSATTHSVNTGARQYRPQFAASGANLFRVDIDANPNVSIAGYWMLFAVDTDGVPSVAQVIKIQRDAPDSGVHNLALTGTATQSSTYPGALDFDPSNAIDDDTTGTNVSGSITHTLNDTNAWWEIDLGEVYDLDNVRIWNRTDCCASRLSDFHVLVSDEPFVSTDLAGTQAQPDVSDFFAAGAASRTTDIALDRTGRYLRIQLSGRNYLQLAEVQIIGQEIVLEPINVAPLGTATQSSTYDSAISFDAGNAIDGNSGGSAGGNSITHTLNEANAWWELDLGRTYDVDTLRLWNRSDCCASRLSNFHVLVSDTPFTSAVLTQTQAQAGVSDFAYPDAAGRTTDFEISRSARYIRVQLGGTNFLQLAEVEVLVDSELSLNTTSIAPSVSGSDITFDVQASGANGTARYSWNFGDGSGDTTLSTNSSATHAYTAPGRYIVSVTVTDDSGVEMRQTFSHVVHRPLTAAKPALSSGITEHAALEQLWNVNPDNNSVSVIPTDDFVGPTQITVGQEPRALAIAPNGAVWVVNKASSSISVIDAVTLTVQQTIALPANAQPHGLVFQGGSAFVALEAGGRVVRLDANSGALTGNVNVGPTPRHLATDALGQLYVSRFITRPLPNEHTGSIDLSGQVGGEILVLDPNTLATTRTITLLHIDREASEHEGPGIPNYLGPVAISPDGTQAWIPSKQDNILAGDLRGGDGMTFDQTVRAITSRVDLTSYTEDLYARIDHDNASVASHAVFDPYGVSLFTSLEGNRQIAISDATTNLEFARFDVAMAPQSLAVSEDGRRLYVHNFMSRSVGVYDISDVVQNGGTQVNEITVLTTVTSDLLPNQILRGKQLFYDARDDRLAALDYMSCAACHNEAGHDGRTWDFTSLGEGLRNTTTLKGKAGLAHGLLHWTGNFDEIQDFEGQIREFAGGLGLMSDADFSTGTRADPLGDPKAFISDDLDALAAYLASLEDTPRSPNAAADGTLSADAQLGRALFAQENCASCHTGGTMTDSTLHDIGTQTAASGQRLGGPLTGIDTPTLLGIFATAPYLHDGSALSIDSAIAAHGGVNLSAAERQQLARYVEEATPATLPGASNNLLINGELEAGRTGGWGTATLDGWSSTNSIEVWASGHAGVATSDGGNLIEIDYFGGTPLDQIWQDVTTESGATYRLTLQMRARNATFQSASESLCVSWRGVSAGAGCFQAAGSGQWTTHTVDLDGSGGSDRLMFSESTEAGASDGFGPLLDLVTLERIAVAPPTPAVELLTNGELEAGRISGWGTATLKGWASTNPIEVWASGHSGIDTYDGGNLVEIDLNGPGDIDQIWQDIDTTAGTTYQLSFQMRARRAGVTSADESVCVFWRGQSLQPSCFQAASAGAWTTHTLSVIGSGGTDRLMLSESAVAGASNGLGPLIDAISLKTTR